MPTGWRTHRSSVTSTSRPTRDPNTTPISRPTRGPHITPTSRPCHRPNVGPTGHRRRWPARRPTITPTGLTRTRQTLRPNTSTAARRSAVQRGYLIDLTRPTVTSRPTRRLFITPATRARPVRPTGATPTPRLGLGPGQGTPIPTRTHLGRLVVGVVETRGGRKPGTSPANTAGSGASAQASPAGVGSFARSVVVGWHSSSHWLRARPDPTHYECCHDLR